MMRALLVCGLVALCLAGMAQSSAAARNLTVEVTGQAAESGLGQSTTRMRALEAALVEAAIRGGAKITGYSAVSNGILVSDRMIVRPESRILDYSILSEERVNGFYRIRVRAVVGDPPTSNLGACARRSQLDIVSYPPRVDIDLATPAWMATLGPEFRDRIDRALRRQSGVSLQQSGVAAPPAGQTAQAGSDMDYMALTRGQKVRTAVPAGKLAYQVDLRLAMEGQRTLVLILASRLTDGQTQAERARSRFESKVPLNAGSPIRALNVLTALDRTKTVDRLFEGLEAHMAGLIDAYACRMLEGNLVLAGNRLTLPFGSKDGLSRHHIAYSEGQDTPYILFEIETLNPNSAVLRPIDRNRPTASLAGMRVRFMELSQ
jgi:hypothetical protein